MNGLIKIPLNINSEYKEMVDDIIRMTCIQIITQFLFCMSNPSVSFINSIFIKTLIFIILSIIIYWVIIKKIIIIEYTDKKNMNNIYLNFN